MAAEPIALEAIYEPSYSISHIGDIEIQEISELKPAQAKVTQELAAMDRQDGFNGLKLDDDTIVHQEIDPVSILDHKIVVAYRNCDLVTNG